MKNFSNYFNISRKCLNIYRNFLGTHYVCYIKHFEIPLESVQNIEYTEHL